MVREAEARGACRPGCRGELARKLLGETRRTLAELVLGVAVATGARAAARAAGRRAEEGALYDVEAERVLLGAALRCGGPIAPWLFGPAHYALACAVAFGDLHPSLLHPEARGYRRGLAETPATLGEISEAADTLEALWALRYALAAAERAALELRATDRTIAHRRASAITQLRAALGALTDEPEVL